MTKQYSVSYTGWVIVTAKSEEEAYEKANKYLSEADLINDGDEGEWMLDECYEEDDDE